MGNACGCADTKKGSNETSLARTHFESLAFIHQNHQSVYTPAAFSQLSSEQKDEVLSEVLNLITSHGDLSKANAKSVLIKALLNRQHSQFTLMTGDKFEGDTVNGIANGKGKSVYAFDGVTTYTGDFKSGAEHGSGTISYPNGDSLKCNTFGRGVPTGLCTYKFADQSEEIMCHDTNGYKNGPFILTESNGMQFLGRYNQGREDGVEVCMPKDGKFAKVIHYIKGTPVKEVLMTPTIKK